MPGADRYYTARVHENDDPEKRGRLQLEIPALLGEGGIWPDWIEPRAPGGAGPGATGLHWIPPTEAIVVVEADHGALALRWMGSTLGGVNSLPDLLTEDYPNRAGFSSPDGSSLIMLTINKAVIDSGDIRLGNQDADKWVALAELVLAQLNALENAFNSHTQTVASGIPVQVVPATGIGATTAPGTAGPPSSVTLSALDDLRSTVVRALQ